MRHLIKCPQCGEFFRSKDVVALDFLNTILHRSCLGDRTGHVIKDTGTFSQIVKLYPYLA